MAVLPHGGLHCAEAAVAQLFIEAGGLKSKGVLADDFMDLSTKARYISFGQKKLRMPLVLSNKGYAIGVAAGSTVLFCNVRTYGQYIYTQGTGQIDYYFIYDENQERNIEQYRNLQV